MLLNERKEQKKKKKRTFSMQFFCAKYTIKNIFKISLVVCPLYKADKLLPLIEPTVAITHARNCIPAYPPTMEEVLTFICE